jgi:hypothetical protein
MRSPALVVVIALVGCLGCFSTAQYEAAHRQRVVSINARYDAARQRVIAHHAQSAGPQVADRTEPAGPQVADRTELSLASSAAPSAPSVPSVPPPAVDPGVLDAQTLVARDAQAVAALERARQAEIAASARQRDREIASHRARVQANAFATADPAAGAAGSVGAVHRCTGVTNDQLLSRVAGCRPMTLPDDASSLPPPATAPSPLSPPSPLPPPSSLPSPSPLRQSAIRR